MGEAVPVSEDVSATCLAFSVVVEFEVEDGLTVGKRPEALPPGLSVAVGATAPMAGRDVTDELLTLIGPGEAEAEAEAAEMTMDPDGSRAVARLVALTTAVRLAEETVVDVTGTVNCAVS